MLLSLPICVFISIYLFFYLKVKLYIFNNKVHIQASLYKGVGKLFL